MLACILCAALVLPQTISFAETISYHYGPAKMLDRAQYNYGKVIHYTYDSRGNRTLMSITSFAVSGAVFNYPEPGFRSALAMDIRASSLQTGWLTYYFTGQRIYLTGDEIESITISGSTVEIRGQGNVNGIGGYSFVVKVNDGDPDSTEAIIINPDGTVYFESGVLDNVAGDIVLGSDDVPTYLLTTLTEPAGAGTITPDCSSACRYESGTAVTFGAAAMPGFSFTAWEGCAEVSGECVW